MFPSSQDPPASKSTQIDAFSRVSNSMLPRTGPPHLSALSPTCSEVLRLNFEPKLTISSPGPLPYQLDDGSSSLFALAGSFRPETTSVSPLGSLASKPMHSEPILSISSPRHGVTVSPCPQDLPASKATRINAFSRVSNLLSPQTSAQRLSEPSRGSCALKITQNVLSSGDYHHPTLSGLSRTNADAPRSFERGGNEGFDEGKHLLGVWKGKDRLASETPQIAGQDHVATEAPAHSMNEPTRQSAASGSTEPYTPVVETQAPSGLLARQQPAPEESDIKPGEHNEDAMVEVRMAIIWHTEQIMNQTRHTQIIAKA